MEPCLAELRSDLASYKYWSSLAETRIIWMTKSYRSLESRAKDLEESVNTLQEKTERLENMLKEDRMHRNKSCSKCSPTTDLDMKSKQGKISSGHHKRELERENIPERQQEVNKSSEKAQGQQHVPSPSFIPASPLPKEVMNGRVRKIIGNGIDEEGKLKQTNSEVASNDLLADTNEQTNSEVASNVLLAETNELNTAKQNHYQQNIRADDKAPGSSKKYIHFTNGSSPQMRSHPSEDQSEDVWSRPNWIPRVEKIFVELLIDEMNKHVEDICPSGFKDDEWDRVCGEFNKLTGLNFDKKELEKHLTVLRKRYDIVKPLHNHGGFGWDSLRKMVEADEQVWAEYIQAHPEIKPYRIWGCPIYVELCTIFTETPVTGEYYPRENHGNSGGANKRQLGQSFSPGPNKKINTGDKMPKTDAASEEESVFASCNDDPYSLECCIKVVNGMQGLDSQLYDAGMKLFQKPYARKMFMLLRNVEERLNWLRRMQT